MLVIDALGLLYRAHYGASREPRRDSRGFDVSATMSVGRWLESLGEGRTERVLAWDCPGRPTFRHVASAEYKRDRTPMPPELSRQLAGIARIAARLGYDNLRAPGYEADDVIATMVDRAQGEVTVVSSDKDVLQLVNERVRVMRPVSGRFGEWPVVDEHVFTHTWGFAPAQLPLYLALCGDRVDGIRGAKGIGPKRALKMVNEGAAADPGALMLTTLRRDAPLEEWNP